MDRTTTKERVSLLDTLAHNVETRRGEFGLTLDELDKRLAGCSESVAVIERAAADVTVEDLEHLAEALETTPATLLLPGAFGAEEGGQS